MIGFSLECKQSNTYAMTGGVKWTKVAALSSAPLGDREIVRWEIDRFLRYYAPERISDSLGSALSMLSGLNEEFTEFERTGR